MNNPDAPCDRLLRLRAVINKTGLSATTISRLRRCGAFPAPIQPTPRTVSWSEREIDAWIAARVAAREQNP
jgi:prophage regulatory protein